MDTLSRDDNIGNVCRDAVPERFEQVGSPEDELAAFRLASHS